jgi:mono/diheme cytochrome c family protein
MMPVRVAIVLAAAAAATAFAQAPRGDAERGKQLFVKTGCYQCHGYEAQGASTGPRLGPEAVAFARFVAYARKPTGDMPPYTARVMSDAQLADIYAFVTSRMKPVKVPRFLGS